MKRRGWAMKQKWTKIYIDISNKPIKCCKNLNSVFTIIQKISWDT